MNIFEEATRLKLRVVYNGNLSVEDLWDLRLPALKLLAINFHKQIKDQENMDLFEVKTPIEAKLQLSFDIVMSIINTKTDEEATAKEAQSIKEQKQRLLGIKERKQTAALEELSIEELDKRLAEL